MIFRKVIDLHNQHVTKLAILHLGDEVSRSLGNLRIRQIEMVSLKALLFFTIIQLFVKYYFFSE